MSLKYLTCPSKILAASINASATSFKLNNIKGWNGVDLTSSDFGSQAFAVIRNANNTILELIEFDPTTIADASITIVRRGLKFTGDLTTEVSTNKLSWVQGDTFIDIGVDTPQMFQWLQEYIDAAIVAGGVPSTTLLLGLVKMSTAPADPANPTAVGTNDPRVPTQDENDALAGGGTFGTPSGSNKFLTEQYPVVAATISFGGGADGDVTISSPTTLTRDMFYNNLTVNSTLNTDGYRVFVQGTLSGTGTIANNNTTAGGNASSPIGGTAGPAKGSGIWKGIAGVAGGNGNDGSPIPDPGVAGINGNKGVIGAAGGAGGNGSSGSGAAGGAAGVNDTTKPIFDKFGALNFAFYSAAATLAQFGLTGSGSGGGGMGQNAVGSGGGGGGSGGSGGVIIIAAKTWAGTFTISATGANGGNGGAGQPNNTGGGGGGAGGTGGTVIVVFGTKTWTGSYVLTGGTGGTGGTPAGTGTVGIAGGNGTTGVSYEYNVNSLL